MFEKVKDRKEAEEEFEIMLKELNTSLNDELLTIFREGFKAGREAVLHHRETTDTGASLTGVNVMKFYPIHEQEFVLDQITYPMEDCFPKPETAGTKSFADSMGRGLGMLITLIRYYYMDPVFFFEQPDEHLGALQRIKADLKTLNSHINLRHLAKYTAKLLKHNAEEFSKADQDFAKGKKRFVGQVIRVFSSK